MNVQPALSTGVAAVDAALGIGGLPRGRVVELFGPEHSGKRELCLRTMAACKASGLHALYIDAENEFDAGKAHLLGLDVVDADGHPCCYVQPKTAEQAATLLDANARSSEVDLIVVAATAALAPKFDCHPVDAVTLQSRFMSGVLRKLTAVAHKSGATIVFVTDLRSNIAPAFGAPEKTPGQNALKFYASVRVEVRRIDGVRSRAKVVKNKCAAPFECAEFERQVGS